MKTALVVKWLRGLADMLESGQYRLMDAEIKADHNGRRYTGEVAYIINVFDLAKCEPDPYLS